MDFWPGFAMKARDTENSIGWRRDKFTAVEKRIVHIPYFNGSPRAMPLVKLRSIDTGVEAWFANFHNPADTSPLPPPAALPATGPPASRSGWPTS